MQSTKLQTFFKTYSTAIVQLAETEKQQNTHKTTTQKMITRNYSLPIPYM